MHTPQHQYLFLVKITIIAFIVSVLPFSDVLLSASPFWLLVFYVYWLIFFPVKAKFFIALILGMLIDILHGDFFGQNALALILASAFISGVKQSFYVSNLSTQVVYVFIASSIYLACLLLTYGLMYGVNTNYYLFLAPFSSAAIWPLVNTLLSKLKH